MSAIYIKQLSFQDFSDIAPLVRNRKKFLNKADNHLDDDAYLHSLRSLLQNYSDSFTLNGVFDKSSGQLICFAGAFQYTTTPTWSLLYVNNTVSGLGLDNPLSMLINFFISYFESKKIFRFVYACPLRGESVYKNESFTSLLARICPELKKYSFFTSEIIEVGQFSKYETHQKLLGNNACKIKMAIRYAELDEKYRTLLD